MRISKFDLYQTEWLDLVFDDRNKDYGAYELRQHYSSTMVRAMGITFFAIAVACGAAVIFRKAPVPIETSRIVEIKPMIAPPVTAVKKVEPLAAKPLKQPAPAKPQATIKSVQMVVTVDEQAQKPVKNDDLVKGTISNVDTKGPETGTNAVPDVPTGGGGTAPAVDDKTIYNTGGLDVMPEPVGGESAWAKFLNKNLRFPPAAQEDGVSGKVFLSFVVEKDGSLSNIQVIKPAGHGFDEEALRVLKLAKAWNPGKQNGQAVRVRYNIPINFQLSE